MTIYDTNKQNTNILDIRLQKRIKHEIAHYLYNLNNKNEWINDK